MSLVLFWTVKACKAKHVNVGRGRTKAEKKTSSPAHISFFTSPIVQLWWVKSENTDSNPVWPLLVLERPGTLLRL